MKNSVEGKPGTEGPGIITDGRPLGLPLGGSDGREETGAELGRGGADRHTGRGTGISCTSYVTSGKDWGLAHSAAVHIQQDRAGGPGMSRFPLSVLWPGSPIPAQVLGRVPGTVLDQSRP